MASFLGKVKNDISIAVYGSRSYERVGIDEPTQSSSDDTRLRLDDLTSGGSTQSDVNATSNDDFSSSPLSSEPEESTLDSTEDETVSEESENESTLDESAPFLIQIGKATTSNPVPKTREVSEDYKRHVREISKMTRPSMGKRVNDLALSINRYMNDQIDERYDLPAVHDEMIDQLIIDSRVTDLAFCLYEDAVPRTAGSVKFHNLRRTVHNCWSENTKVLPSDPALDEAVEAFCIPRDSITYESDVGTLNATTNLEKPVNAPKAMVAASSNGSISFEPAQVKCNTPLPPSKYAPTTPVSSNFEVQKPAPKSKTRAQCTYCKKWRHTAEQCFKRINDEKRAARGPYCTYCHEHKDGAKFYHPVGACKTRARELGLCFICFGKHRSFECPGASAGEPKGKTKERQKSSNSLTGKVLPNKTRGTAESNAIDESLMVTMEKALGDDDGVRESTAVDAETARLRAVELVLSKTEAAQAKKEARDMAAKALRLERAALYDLPNSEFIRLSSEQSIEVLSDLEENTLERFINDRRLNGTFLTMKIPFFKENLNTYIRRRARYERDVWPQDVVDMLIARATNLGAQLEFDSADAIPWYNRAAFTNYYIHLQLLSASEEEKICDPAADLRPSPFNGERHDDGCVLRSYRLTLIEVVHEVHGCVGALMHGSEKLKCRIVHQHVLRVDAVLLLNVYASTVGSNILSLDDDAKIRRLIEAKVTQDRTSGVSIDRYRDALRANTALVAYWLRASTHKRNAVLSARPKA